MTLPPLPSSQPGFGDAESFEWRALLRDAIHYWEPRRAAYNLVLTLVAVIWLGWTWPHFRPAMSLQALYPLPILATLANVCYSAAYVADIAAQQSSFASPGVVAAGVSGWQGCSLR